MIIYIIDFQDVQGQDSAIEFVAVVAAGGHNILMSGSSWLWKIYGSKKNTNELPSMTEEEALEVTKIYSGAGLLKNIGSLISENPNFIFGFRTYLTHAYELTSLLITPITMHQ